jgi:hypothetical protein
MLASTDPENRRQKGERARRGYLLKAIHEWGQRVAMQASGQIGAAERAVIPGKRLGGWC